MLFIVSTPIGNLEDITLRALRVLKEADVIVCEDTRHTGLLLKHFEIPHKPLISYFDDVEEKRTGDILALVEGDQKVALVSDAGTPLISDPGFKLVREAVKRNLKIEVVPGPSSPIVALTASGLPPDKFMFLGYPPEKDSHQKDLLSKLKNNLEILKFTSIFLVSPHKFQRFVNNLAEIFPDSNVVVARELTKIHEEVWQGKPAEALEKFKHPLGEMVVLVAIS